jgi:hypothetical protein
MQTNYTSVRKLVIEEVEIAFNYSRLQALFCMTASVFVSGGLLLWIVRAYI